MLRNKIAMILVIVITGVFASLYGGPVTRGLFYLSFIIPIVSFLYAVYVYFSFSPIQQVKPQIVVKGKKARYSLRLVNNSIFPYTNVKMEYYSDKQDIENKKIFNSYCVVPKEEYLVESDILCRNRGLYTIGIKKIIIRDFFNIFKISSYPKVVYKVRVLPRLFNLNNIRSELDTEMDIVKTDLSVVNKQERPDIEMRKYISGDNKKMIHWKASAKKQELLSRKYINNPDPDMKIILDLKPVNVEKAITAETEDKIIETALAIMKYYQRCRKRTTVVFSDENVNQLEVGTDNEFNVFYNKCAELEFKAQKTPSDCIIKCLERSESGSHFVLVTNSISEDVISMCTRAIEFENYVTIVLVNSDAKNKKNLEIHQKISVIPINKNQEIVDVLERK